MNNFEVVENCFLDNDFGSLFNSPKFFNLHSKSGDVYFDLCKNGRSVASIHFSALADTGTWRSPARGTYAGLAFDAELQYRELFCFYEQVESALRNRGVKRLEILPAPQAHNMAAFAKQFYLLRGCGFEVVQCDINQSIEVDQRIFAERIGYGNLKRLRKSRRQGLVVEKLPLSDLPNVYETLAINRLSKGRCLSMTLADIQLMLEKFPESIALFGCPDKTQFAAAAFCLHLSKDILYVVYWGDRPEYASNSLVVSIAEAIYRYSQESGVKILDAGTSTIDREVNFGLLEFKCALDFEESIKVRMAKEL